MVRSTGPRWSTGCSLRTPTLFEYLADEVLAGLPTPEREVLALAAHLPHVSTTLLRDLDRNDLVPLLAPLGEGGVFLEPDPNTPDGYRATLLGGEFLRRSEPVPGREVLHRAVDAMITRGDVDNALLLGTRAGDPQLARRVLQAVDRVDRLGTPDALTETLRIAEPAGPDPRIAELHGDLQYLHGDWDTALASYAEAAALGDPASPRLARKRGIILYLRGRLDEADGVFAAARLDGTDPAEEAQVLAWRAAVRWVRSDVAGCEELIGPAEAAANAAGDDAALAAVHTTRAMIAAFQADRRANEWSYRKALEHAERAGDVIQMIRIHTNMGSHFSEEGSYPEAIAELDTAIGLAELAGSDSFTGHAYANRGDTFTRMGRLDDALRDLRQAQRIWERLESDDVAYALAYLGDVQYLRGQQSEARSFFQRAIELAEQGGDVQGLVPALVGLARVLTDDDLTAAAATAERAVTIARPLWRSQAHSAAGWIDLHRGDRQAAQRHADMALEQAHTQLDRPSVAEALLLLGATQDPPAASRAEEAGRLWHELGNPIGEARALLMVAETLSGEARAEHVAKAERLLYDAGAWRYLADVRRLAAEPATTPPPVAISHARRLPGDPRRRPGGDRGLGFAQGPRSPQAARRPARRPGCPRRGHRDAVARRDRPLGPSAVRAVEHDPQRARPDQGVAARALRRRRSRRAVARSRARRGRRRAVPHRGGRGPAPAHVGQPGEGSRRARPGRRRGTSETSAPTIRMPIGRRARASWRGTRSSKPPGSSPGSPRTAASTARPCATGCGSSTSIPTTRPPTSTSSGRSACSAGTARPGGRTGRTAAGSASSTSTPPRSPAEQGFFRSERASKRI